jgi:outer membrane protein assembly factor BamB
MLRRHFLALAASQKGPGTTWTQWGGPHRDFRSASTGLASSWPAGGPKKLWSRSFGDGYSGIAVEDGVLYTMYGTGRREVAAALDAQTGKTLWESDYAAGFVNAFSEKVGPGPYAMPQVAGPLLYTTGATGRLCALDKKTGRGAWSHDLYREFDGTRLEFGYSCHPLLYKNTLIVAAGGRDASFVAFDATGGRLLWKKNTSRNAHSSPLLIRVDGTEQAVCLMADEVVGIDPSNGNLLWRHKHATQHGLAVATPVDCGGNLLFVSSSYGGGARLLQLWNSGGQTGVKEVWYSNRINVHFGSIVRDGGTLYCSSGHGPAFLTGVDVQSGKILWQSRDFVKAQLLAADGKLIVLDEDGNLGLVAATPQGMKVLAKAAVLTSISWTMPSLAGTTLYVRDRRSIQALLLG